MRLANMTAVVTGGTRGLGRAIAQAYLDEGATVVCAGRTPCDTSGIHRPSGGRIEYRHVDVADEESVGDLMRWTAEQLGRIDVLVANAGVHRDGKVERLGTGDWTAMMTTNLTGSFLCTRAVIPYMKDQGAGRIITMSSSMATRAAVGAAGYCASKAAIEMFTRVSAMELAPAGILVNCLAPGVIDEGMGRVLRTKEKVWSAYSRRFASGRPGAAEEVADAAVFLASAESSYVNGHVLEVNGGLLWA